ncbi:Nucleic acid dioxygenase ALKBH1 [Taenia crassiceps]|uniref:Nucleic acid dioxygenase ALKBH1 n=1 Tax=Taenia crassiceps TaxID=6207 RepID=A0ABR4Q4U8_9CEST
MMPCYMTYVEAERRMVHGQIRGQFMKSDLEFDTFVLSYDNNPFLEPSFTLQYNFAEEFFLLRSAIAESAFLSFYEEALFDWPLASSARNNLLEAKIDSDLWFRNFIEFSNPCKTSQLLDRLRWITLGYHYDWDNKVYPPGCQSQFPTKCGDFFKSIASIMSEVVGDRQDLLTQRSYYDNFVPEASIVNYYRKKTTMGFHIDDSENGDVMVTGGHSRLAYHAVPRLLSWRNPSQCLSHDFFPSLLAAFKKRSGEDGIRENLENCRMRFSKSTIS